MYAIDCPGKERTDSWMLVTVLRAAGSDVLRMRSEHSSEGKTSVPPWLYFMFSGDEKECLLICCAIWCRKNRATAPIKQRFISYITIKKQRFATNHITNIFLNRRNKPMIEMGGIIRFDTPVCTKPQKQFFQTSGQHAYFRVTALPFITIAINRLSGDTQSRSTNLYIT